MRRVMILMVSVLTIVTMALSPAFAGDWDDDGWDEEFGFWILVPLFVEVDGDDDFCDWYDCGDWDHGDWYDCDDEHGWEDCDDDHDWEEPVHLID